MQVSFSLSFIYNKKIDLLISKLSNELSVSINTHYSSNNYIEPDNIYTNSYVLHTKKYEEEEGYEQLLKIFNSLSGKVETSNLSLCEIHYHDWYTNKFFSLLRLNINEKELYNTFSMKNPQCKSVKHLKLTDTEVRGFMIGDNTINLVSNNLSSNYAIDSSNMPKVLTFKYIQGNYLEDFSKIMYTIDLYKDAIKKSWNDDISNGDVNKLNYLFKFNERLKKSYNNYKIFKKTFPKITLMADLKTNEVYVNTYFPTFIRQLVILLSSLRTNKEFKINYDSDTKRLQLKDFDGNIQTTKDIHNYELVECNINHSEIYSLNMYDCVINNSYIQDTDLISCEVNNSEVRKSMIDMNSIMSSCFIHTNSLVNGLVKSSLVRNCYIGPESKFENSE